MILWVRQIFFKSCRRRSAAWHGLSLLIDTGTKKILLNAGQPGNFMLNARSLGIDPAEIDAVVLSLGHYDHTGGLYTFLNVNTRVTVFCKKETFIPKYSARTKKFIGITYQENLLKERIVFVESLTQLATAAQQAIFSRISQQKEIVLFTISGEEEQECSLDIYDEVPDFPFYGKHGLIGYAAIRVLWLQENTVGITGILKGDAYPQRWK